MEATQTRRCEEIELFKTRYHSGAGQRTFFEISRLKDKLRRLATQLQRHLEYAPKIRPTFGGEETVTKIDLFQVALCGSLHYLPSSDGAARECDLVHIGVGGKCGPAN